MIVVRLAFPEAFEEYVTFAFESGSVSVIDSFSFGFRSVIRIFTSVGTSVPIWSGILAIVIIFAVCLHINLSLYDIKSCIGSIPDLLIATSLFAVITMLFGVEKNIRGALEDFSSVAVNMFMIVIIFSLLLILAAIAIWVLKKIWLSIIR